MLVSWGRKKGERDRKVETIALSSLLTLTNVIITGDKENQMQRKTGRQNLGFHHCGEAKKGANAQKEPTANEK